MPHQCLSCGFAFQEGSSELLNGCPECKGTRFFYSATPVPEAEREQLQAKAQKDIRQVVTDLLADSHPEAAQELIDKADADGWARIGPRDLRRLVKKVQADEKATKVPDVREEPADSRRRIQAAQKAWARLQDELGEETEETPDTVTIEGSGEYAIDIKGLLEKNPIVVHKDGAYMIHLPSLFRE